MEDTEAAAAAVGGAAVGGAAVGEGEEGKKTGVGALSRQRTTLKDGRRRRGLGWSDLRLEGKGEAGVIGWRVCVGDDAWDTPRLMRLLSIAIGQTASDRQPERCRGKH